MLTADLYAMRFYCSDYYVEHFIDLNRNIAPMQANAASINSRAEEAFRWRGRGSIFLSQYYAKYPKIFWEKTRHNPQNCKHKIISSLVVKYHDMEAKLEHIPNVSPSSMLQTRRARKLRNRNRFKKYLLFRARFFPLIAFCALPWLRCKKGTGSARARGLVWHT